jgi:hypothetical protein
VKLVERFEPQSKIKNGGKTGKRKAATTRCRLSFARINAGRVNGRKMNMKATLTPTISIPSPIGSACLRRKTGRRTMKAVSTRVANSNARAKLQRHSP